MARAENWSSHDFAKAMTQLIQKMMPEVPLNEMSNFAYELEKKYVALDRLTVTQGAPN